MTFDDQKRPFRLKGEHFIGGAFCLVLLAIAWFIAAFAWRVWDKSI